MAIVTILNLIGFVILFAILTVLSIFLFKAYKAIRKIENEKSLIKQRAEYHEKELKRRAGENEDTIGHDFEERK